MLSGNFCSTTASQPPAPLLQSQQPRERRLLRSRGHSAGGAGGGSIKSPGLRKESGGWFLNPMLLPVPSPNVSSVPPGVGPDKCPGATQDTLDRRHQRAHKAASRGTGVREGAGWEASPCRSLLAPWAGAVGEGGPMVPVAQPRLESLPGPASWDCEAWVSGKGPWKSCLLSRSSKSFNNNFGERPENAIQFGSFKWTVYFPSLKEATCGD